MLPRLHDSAVGKNMTYIRTTKSKARVLHVASAGARWWTLMEWVSRVGSLLVGNWARFVNIHRLHGSIEVHNWASVGLSLYWYLFPKLEKKGGMLRGAITQKVGMYEWELTLRRPSTFEKTYGEKAGVGMNRPRPWLTRRAPSSSTAT